jgi:TRAP-type uncharacterized transport system substrate-binding protein
MLFKFILIILIILIVFFVSSLYAKRFYEHYTSYKSHLIQLKKEVSNPIVIAVGDENRYISNFSKVYSYKFPMLRYNNEGGTYNSMKLVDDSKCDMCITQLEMAEALYKGQAPYTKSNKNIRIVCNLNDISLLFMANTNFNIDNTDNDINSNHLTLGALREYTENNSITIAVDNYDIGIYEILMKILFLYSFNTDNINVLQEDIFNADDIFQNGDIDILVTNIIHPDVRIKDLYQQYNFQFIGIDDITLSNLHVKSPYYKRGSINLMDYDVELFNTRMLDVFSCPLCIICNYTLDEQTIYKFINGLFENIEYIRKHYKKTTENIDTETTRGLMTEVNYYNIKTYKDTSSRQIDSLLPSSYYNIKSLIPIHDGTKKYLKHIGLITNIDNQFCKNYLPDSNPNNIINFSENCNNNPILKKSQHYGHGYFG